MCACVSQGWHAPAPHAPSITRVCVHSVNRHALSTYCVPGPCWLLGRPWELTRAHPELREERHSPFNPGRGAARHALGGGLARPSRAGAPASARRPLPPTPTSRLQVMEIRIQASFQHLHDFLHRAMLNVIHAFFQIGLKRKKKKAPLQDVPSRATGRSVTRGAQGGRPLMGSLPILGSPSSGVLPPEPQDEHGARRVAHTASSSWTTGKSSRFTVLAKSQGTLLPAWTTANSYGGQGPLHPRPDSALVSEAYGPTSVFSGLRPGHHGKPCDHTGRDRDAWSLSDSK